MHASMCYTVLFVVLLYSSGLGLDRHEQRVDLVAVVTGMLEEVMMMSLGTSPPRQNSQPASHTNTKLPGGHGLIDRLID